MAKTEKVLATGVSVIDDLLTANKWAASTVSFGFSNTGASYGTGYGRGEATEGFKAFTAQQQDTARAAFAAWSSVANIDFVETTGTGAEIRLASSTMPTTAWAYTPSEGDFGGDVWIGTARYNANPEQGNYASMTIMHEIGHALGLGHPHAPKFTSVATGQNVDGSQDALCPCCAGAVHGQVADLSETSGRASEAIKALDAMAYSVMSYRSFEGANIADGYQNETYGYAQSPMARDIAAIQHLYGANYDTNASNTIYAWSEITGEKFVNDVGQGSPGANKVFETIWDGNGVDTFDLSNFKTDIVADLNPGGWTDFGTKQLARLGAGEFAPGNVATAYLHAGDTRSLIENVVGGSGNDHLIGNLTDNVLVGGSGNDAIYGGAGQDILVGGNLGNELSLIGMNYNVLAPLALPSLQSDGNDILLGGEGNDVFVPGTGQNEVYGGAGSDTLILNLSTSAIVIVEQTEGFHLITFQGGSVLATEIEFLALTDGLFAFGSQVLDAVASLADEIALLYRAGFGREIDAGGRDYWLGAVDSDNGLNHMAGALIESAEFSARFGQAQSMDDASFVDVLYENVLGREGETAGLDYWSQSMSNGVTRSEVLLAFSQSAENVAAFSDRSSSEVVELTAVSSAQWSQMLA